MVLWILVLIFYKLILRKDALIIQKIILHDCFHPHVVKNDLLEHIGSIRFILTIYNCYIIICAIIKTNMIKMLIGLNILWMITLGTRLSVLVPHIKVSKHLIIIRSNYSKLWYNIYWLCQLKGTLIILFQIIGHLNLLLLLLLIENIKIPGSSLLVRSNFSELS